MKIEHINLFVYDSMIKGRLNNVILEDSPLISAASIKGFDSYDMGTFVSVLPGEGTVDGEVYRVNSKVLKSIDRFQGYGKLFKRTPTTCILPSGESLAVEVYTLMDRCFARYNRKI